MRFSGFKTRRPVREIFKLTINPPFYGYLVGPDYYQENTFVTG